MTTTAELRTCALSIKPLGSMAFRLTLKNWENVNNTEKLGECQCAPSLFGHLSTSDTWSWTITEMAGVGTLSIWPLVSIWHLGYHCKGWGMYTIHLATCQHLTPRLLLQRLGYLQDKKEIKKCPILCDSKQETSRGSLDIANLDLDLDLVEILDLDPS